MGDVLSTLDIKPEDHVWLKGTGNTLPMASLQSALRLPGKDLVSHDWLNKPNMGFTRQANPYQLAPIICQGRFCSLNYTPQSFQHGKAESLFFPFLLS